MGITNEKLSIISNGLYFNPKCLLLHVLVHILTYNNFKPIIRIPQIASFTTVLSFASL